MRLGWIAQQGLDLGRPEITRIDSYDAASRMSIDSVLVEPLAAPFYFHSELGGGARHELPHRMLDSGGDHEILGLRLLQHEPLGANIVPGVSPVAQGVQISKIQAGFQAFVNPRQAAR